MVVCIYVFYWRPGRLSYRTEIRYYVGILQRKVKRLSQVPRPPKTKSVERPQFSGLGQIRSGPGLRLSDPSALGIKDANLFQVDELSDGGQDDADDGGDVDEADEEGHDEFADGLLVAGDAALAGDARAHGGHRKCDRNYQELKNGTGLC